MNEKKCTNCGGDLRECIFNAGLFTNLTVTIPNGSNFPIVHSVDTFICEKCGKVNFYAKLDDNKEKT